MKKVARMRIAVDEHANIGGGSNASSEQIGVRTTGRIKKPKAVFDPSDNYLPRAQRVSNTSSGGSTPVGQQSANNSLERRQDAAGITQKRLSQSSTASACTTASLTSPYLANDICCTCSKKEPKRGLGAKNKLITCIDCDIKVHKLCLKIDFEDLDVLRARYKCENCRMCVLCAAFADSDTKPNELITCAKCVKTFHLSCHIPSVHKYQQQSNNWKCNKCSTLPASVGNGNVLPARAIREIIGDDSMLFLTANNSTKQNAVKLNDKQPKVNIAEAAEEAKHSAAAAKRIRAPTPPPPLNNATCNGANAERTNKTVSSTLATGATTSSSAAAVATTVTTSAAGIASAADVVDAKRSKLSEPSADAAAGVAATTAAPSAVTATNASARYSPNEPLELPDVKYWNVDQVTDFFAKYFPNEAYVFKEHEIDGMSLLLLKRSDVIKKLPIKLGPSLRIYSLILKIQSQLNDPTLGWNCGM